MAVGTILSELPVSRLHQGLAYERDVFMAQPQMTRIFMVQQATQIAEALLERSRQIRFVLPDRIVLAGVSEALIIPAGRRQQTTGGWVRHSSVEQARQALIHLFDELERDPEPVLSVAGSTMRYVVASTMIYQMLPDGHPVTYSLVEGDQIPTLPAKNEQFARSALTAAADAIVEDEAGQHEQVQVPFVPAARCFFLPQWVVLDGDDRLLVKQASDAEGYLASMQRYVEILHHAVAIAPYMVADEAYQRKRAGMLGQLVNQGRALARFYTRDIIETIKRRARENNLNRGLRLVIPYFDDQQLEMGGYPMTIVPAGRIIFVPAFLVRAVRLEVAKVAHSMSINASTRRHLLAELAMLETAFIHVSPSKQDPP